jgi:coenzyme F420 hydrogenase subunit beta
MKTFFDLKQEVHATGRCHGCGGCVTFCTAINYGALTMGEDNIPRYKSVEKCIDCGLCYMICPVIGELDQKIKEQSAWSTPMGRIIDITVAQVNDEDQRARATDGGVVTGILLHLFDTGRIDGAIVAKNTPEGRQPVLAQTREDIIDAAGSHFDTNQGAACLGENYSTYSPSAQALGSLIRQGLKRIAFVGTPCQIKSVRKMQALKIVPSDAIKYYFGLFCTANFNFSGDKMKELEKLADCKMQDVKKLNIKDDLILHRNEGGIARIAFRDLEFAKRSACSYCDDFTAEYADISFGGLGAAEGWTTVITRTPVGRAVFADARDAALSFLSIDDNPDLDRTVLQKLQIKSAEKKTAAEIRQSIKR